MAARAGDAPSEEPRADWTGVRTPVAACASCGAHGERMYPVRRRYVTPAAWDTPARELTMAEVEQWCFSCCTHYPHEPAEPAEPA